MLGAVVFSSPPARSLCLEGQVINFFTFIHPPVSSSSHLPLLFLTSSFDWLWTASLLCLLTTHPSNPTCNPTCLSRNPLPPTALNPNSSTTTSHNPSIRYTPLPDSPSSPPPSLPPSVALALSPSHPALNPIPTAGSFRPPWSPRPACCATRRAVHLSLLELTFFCQWSNNEIYSVECHERQSL
jgi:hypothetical protein